MNSPEGGMGGKVIPLRISRLAAVLEPDKRLEIVFDREIASIPLAYLLEIRSLLYGRDTSCCVELFQEIDDMVAKFLLLRSNFMEYHERGESPGFEGYAESIRSLIRSDLIELGIVPRERVSNPEDAILYCRERLGGIFQQNRIFVTPRLRLLLNEIKSGLGL